MIIAATEPPMVLSLHDAFDTDIRNSGSSYAHWRENLMSGVVWTAEEQDQGGFRLMVVGHLTDRWS